MRARNILGLLYAAALMLASCVNEPENITGGGVPAEGEKEYTFAVNIPGAGYITRSMTGYDDTTDENKNLLISNMWVMVFDETGYLSRHQAYQSGGVAQFAVKLPLSDKPRVLHFVCNYDWTGFSDESMKLLNEATVMTGMTRVWEDESQPMPILYWGRVRLPGGITEGMSLGEGGVSAITLKRNVAQVSVVNNSKAAAEGDQYDEVESYLTAVEFAIGNYLDRGTVTGFDKTLSPSDANYLDGLFDGVYEARTAAVIPLTNQDAGKFAAASSTDTDETVTGASLFTYERRNSDPTQADHLYIIIKGDYHANAATAGVTRYYKVDIVVEGDTQLKDVIRNKHYILTINQVMNEGYNTIEDAVESLALNNIATSVMQSYNSISDGTAILNIEYVNRTFVAGRNSAKPYDFNIRYSYITDATTGATDNADVAMDWGPQTVSDNGYASRAVAGMDALPNNKELQGFDNGEPVYPPGYGGQYLDYITGRLIASPPSTGVYSSWIRIFKGNLSRTINLRLRQPYTFEPMSISPEIVPNRLGEQVAVSFNIPETLDDQLPFVMYIYADMLAPDYTKSNVYHDDSEGIFRHRYTVTNTGPHTLYFLTGSTLGQGYVTLRSDLFGDASRYLERPNDNFNPVTITSVVPNGDGLPPESGQTVRINFNIPTGYIAGDNILIHTGLLEPLGPASTSDGGSIGKADESDQFYTYTPAAFTPPKTFWVDFRTTTDISAEQINISSEHLQTAYYERSNYYYNFGANFVRTGDKLAINLTLSNHTSLMEARSVEIYIQTQYMQPDSAYPDQGLVLQELEGIRGYLYSTTVSSYSESRTIYLEPVGTPTAETLYIGSEKYDPAIYQYQ